MTFRRKRDYVDRSSSSPKKIPKRIANAASPADFTNKVYNCVVYQMSDRAYIAVSADLPSISGGEGCSERLAIASFKSKIECCIEDQTHNLSPDQETLSPDKQMTGLKELEDDWANDDVVYQNAIHASLVLFSTSPPSPLNPGQ
jgi:hypothetical protein